MNSNEILTSAEITKSFMNKVFILGGNKPAIDGYQEKVEEFRQENSLVRFYSIMIFLIFCDEITAHS